MRRVTREDGPALAYRTFGAGSRPVLFVHGWMMSGNVWDPLLEELELPDRRLIVPDLRGAGESEAADEYSIEAYVEDVRHIADDAEADTFDLIGHSMGGQIAQLFAATYPDRVRKMALLSPVPASGQDLPEEAHELFYHSGGDREAQGMILDQACLNLAPEDKEALLDQASAIPADCIQQSYLAWTEADFADQLGEIEAETLVVASDDPFLPPDFLEQAIVEPIERARLVHIPEAGHYIHVEQTASAKKELEKFLNS